VLYRVIDNVLLLGNTDNSQPSDFSVTKCILATDDDQQPGQLLEKNANNNNVVAILVKPDLVTTPSGKEHTQLHYIINYYCFKLYFGTIVILGASRSSTSYHEAPRVWIPFTVRT